MMILEGMFCVCIYASLLYIHTHTHIIYIYLYSGYIVIAWVKHLSQGSHRDTGECCHLKSQANGPKNKGVRSRGPHNG